jgi:hypothetical protein
MTADHHIAVPEVGGHRHALAAVYRVEVLDVVQRLLQEGRLRTGLLFDCVPTRFVSEGPAGRKRPAYTKKAG